MRSITKDEIVTKIKQLCMDVNYVISEDMENVYHESFKIEESPVGKEILKQIIKNVELAKETSSPMCQDTGFAVFFVELGRDLHLECDLEEAINEGVREGYSEGFLRKSIVRDPLNRVNTNDNTPAIIYLKSVAGDKIKVKMAAKGGGSENMSKLAMLKPSDGLEGVMKFVVDTVEAAGPNPCPPTLIGVGIGGTFEKSAQLAKEALYRHVGSIHPDLFYAKLEHDLLERINKLGIGPMGMGGRVTSFAVFINAHPCHIASLPVAVNIQCHSARHKEIEI